MLNVKVEESRMKDGELVIIYTTYTDEMGDVIVTTKDLNDCFTSEKWYSAKIGKTEFYKEHDSRFLIKKGKGRTSKSALEKLDSLKERISEYNDNN